MVVPCWWDGIEMYRGNAKCGYVNMNEFWSSELKKCSFICKTHIHAAKRHQYNFTISIYSFLKKSNKASLASKQVHENGTHFTTAKNNLSRIVLHSNSYYTLHTTIDKLTMHTLHQSITPISSKTMQLLCTLTAVVNSFYKLHSHLYRGNTQAWLRTKDQSKLLAMKETVIFGGGIRVLSVALAFSTLVSCGILIPQASIQELVDKACKAKYIYGKV